MTSFNCYEDNRRAKAYDELGLGGTYYLAFSPLPQLLRKFCVGKRALDFGCGTGRSTRFLKELGFDTIGIDISREMLSLALSRDADGDYRHVIDGDFRLLQNERFDLILSAFPFDNVSTKEHKARLLRGLRELLAPSGVLVHIVSTPEIYINEWVTFTTKAFLENRHAQCGDVVKIITCDSSDDRPVEDILWTNQEYLSIYVESGLNLIHCEAPIASGNEGIEWKSETVIPPWRIYILGCN